ncbi:MAG TPA: DUF3375 domain-containing protein [Cyanobacteria bacterium UBA11049]|nr:DUF3375 domain-containing protein [Cyanobacteria bacterium UBA11049]
MDYDRIKLELEKSPSLKLLRSRNAPLILSFLYKQFKVRSQISIPQSELETKLGDYLEFLQEIDTNAYPRSPKEYLNEWCDNDKLLRKTFEPGSDDPVFALTPAMEDAIGWLEEQEQRTKREFVGTESRFLQIFSLLKDIRDNSTTDVETRIAQLEQERDRIGQEIDKIRQTGAIDPYNRTQIQERFLQADHVARQLIADFTEVEQNFRALTRTVQAAQVQANTRKGSVLGSVLDADEALKESDQGRSFYAFWNFLMSQSKRQELKSLIQAVYNLEELRPLSQEYALLRRIERSLIDAGQRIVQTNHLLAEKLRQMLDEDNLSENRRVAELIAEVQRLALQVASQPLVEGDFLVLEGEPNVNLVMARPLHPLQASDTPTFSIDFNDLPEENLDEEIADLYHQFYVDEAALAQRIAQVLERRAEVTLAELIELYPVEQGLSEIVAYLAIATKAEQHSINDTTTESIVIPSMEPETQLCLTLPQVVFRR